MFLKKTVKTFSYENETKTTRKPKENPKDFLLKKTKKESVFVFFAKTFSWFSRFRQKENENAKLKKMRKRENDENGENVFVPTSGL